MRRRRQRRRQRRLDLLLDLEKLVCLETWERGGNLLNTFQAGQTSTDQNLGSAGIDRMNRKTI